MALFGKILKNECDEEFRFIQLHVRDTLQTLVKQFLKEKYNFKSESDIGHMVEGV